jgi:hypothetical protein
MFLLTENERKKRKRREVMHRVILLLRKLI